MVWLASTVVNPVVGYGTCLETCNMIMPMYHGNMTVNSLTVLATRGIQILQGSKTK